VNVADNRRLAFRPRPWSKRAGLKWGDATVPVILRFLLIVGILAGCVYGGMLALVAFYEPEPREISITIPSSKLAPR
jgi:hypothetical protein